MSASTRILLADDHDVVRKGLRALLEAHPGWEVCGEAANGREAVEMALANRPDIAVLDLTMPELDGLEATRRIRADLPQTEVLIFTLHESEELVRQCLAAGARGYVLKSDAARQLVGAIQSLVEHRPFFTGAVAETIVEGFLRQGEPGQTAAARPASLTPREREIVHLLADGLSNKDVAGALGISVKTVETHRGTIMRKLGLTSLAELVRYAIRNRIVEA